MLSPPVRKCRPVWQDLLHVRIDQNAFVSKRVHIKRLGGNYTAATRGGALLAVRLIWDGLVCCPGVTLRSTT